MTSGQKIAFSLLTTIILVAGFVVTAQSTMLFKILDDRYYSQTQVKEKNDHLDSVAQSLNSYITNVLNQLNEGENAYVKQDCVRSYMDQNPSEALQQDRRDLTAQLFNDIPALSGIRLVDKNGKSLHYSSYDNDVLKVNGSYKTYKNYPDVAKDSDELDFSLIKVNENAPLRRVLLDSDKNRIIVSVPFDWIGDVYSGTMFFYLNFKDIEQELINSKAISYGENIKLVSEGFAGGIIINLPNVDQKDFVEPVTDQWRKATAIKSPEKILEMQDGRFWLMLSNSTCEYAAVAGVYTSDTFQLPQELIWVIYGCVAVTIFLISFLLFSFRRNSEAVIKRRLKKIQYGIIKEYLDNKEKIEWSSVVKQLKTRKDDLSGDIYSSLGVHSKKQKKHLDEFLEKSWAEIFEVLEGSKSGSADNSAVSAVAGGVAGITMEQLRNMLEEVLQETSLNINVANIKSTSKPVPVAVSKVEELDDVEEIEDAEEVEELDDVEEIEDAEEVEELDDVEEIEDAEDVEELDDVEELEDAENVTEQFRTPDNPIKFAQALNPIGYQYSESKETFIRGDLFASTSDLFAEELSLGPEYVSEKVPYVPLEFIVYELPKLSEMTLTETDIRTKGTESIVAAQIQTKGTESIVPVQASAPVPTRKKAKLGLLAAASAIINNEISLKEEPDTVEEVEELSSNDDYSMTQFGSNPDTVQDLESAPQDSIVEKEEGLYEIANDLEYSEVKMDKSFQSLVDSVLK